MAKIYLKKVTGSSDSITVASASEVFGDLYGQEELIIIPNDASFPTGIVVEQTIEKVTLSGALSDYTFAKSGTTDVLVYRGGILVATIRPQTDDDAGSDGSTLAFTTGSVLSTTLNIFSASEIRIGGVGGQVLTGTAEAYVFDTTAPVFTSAATANAAENQNLLYTAVATDAGGVTYSLGGTDAGLLNIASDGKVTLKTGNLDFDAVGAKTSYSFNVIATDAASNAATQAVAVTVTNVDDTAPATPTFALATDSGTAADGITNVGTVNVTGVETGATWQYSTDSGSTWSAAQAATTTTFTLAAGTYATGAYSGDRDQ
jgi:hypothetical protein